MPNSVLTACIQTRPQPDFGTAFVELAGLVRMAIDEGAGFIALPEYCGGLKCRGPKLCPPSQPEDSHPILQNVAELAADGNVWILIGSIAVDGPDGRIFNRGFLVDNRGNVAARYDKLHMFDIQLSDNEIFRESAVVEPGSSAVVARAPFGKIGMTICYDLRFPGLYRDLAAAGAGILTVPAAFLETTGRAHWHVLNRARAIENGCYVVAPCAIGQIPGGSRSYGHSLIVDPWGEVVVDGETDRGIIMAEIDLDKVAAARAKIPSLTHGRSYRFESSSIARVA